jgi:hypothetical protein
VTRSTARAVRDGEVGAVEERALRADEPVQVGILGGAAVVALRVRVGGKF